MSDTRQQKAMAGAACAPLSRIQKRNICMLAAEAWERAGRPFFDPNMDPAFALCKTSALELWRHEQQERLTGRKHLTRCGQADYLLLKSHFERLAGKARQAEADERRMPGDDNRQAQAVLRREISVARRQIADPRRYAATIAQAKYKTGLDNLSSKQTWTIIFDLRRAASGRKKKANQPNTPF